MDSISKRRLGASLPARTNASRTQEYFLENVRREMAERLWSQAELARAMGVSPSHVSQLFSRLRNPGLKTVESVGRIFGMHAVELLMPPDSSAEVKRLVRQALAKADAEADRIA